MGIQRGSMGIREWEIGNSEPFSSSRFFLLSPNKFFPSSTCYRSRINEQNRNQKKVFNMIKDKTYDLFISHGWEYNDNYYRMLEFLDKVQNAIDGFTYEPTSEAEHDAPHRKYEDELKVEMRAQIDRSDALFILSDQYEHYAFWLDFAMDYAQKIGKPILGMRPWGETTTPAAVEQHADTMLQWDTGDIEKALNKYC